MELPNFISQQFNLFYFKFKNVVYDFRKVEAC